MNTNEERLFPLTRQEIVAEILKKYNLPAYYDKEIEKYLIGEKSEKSLVCCHTGCSICEGNIYLAVQEAKKLLPSVL